MKWSEVTAVFGGTFDPPHRGHREAVRGLFAIPGVKRALVIPAATPPHKPGVASAEHRVAMARLNLAATPADPFPFDVALDLRELRRAEATGRPSYTFETLHELSREIPGHALAFVVGADQLRDLSSWYRFPEVLDAAHWIVLERRPDGAAVARETLREWVGSGLARPEADPSGWETWRLRNGPSRLIAVPTDAPAISSTAVRETLGRTGQAPAGTLLPEIEAYLKAHRLYGTQETK